jgi:hypothetical protein
MATLADLLKQVGSGVLSGAQTLQKNTQQAIVDWATKNPTQAGNILNVQKTISQAPAKVLSTAVSKIITPIKAVPPQEKIIVQKSNDAKPTTGFGNISVNNQQTQNQTQQKTGGAISGGGGGGNISSSAGYLPQALKDVETYYMKLLENSNWDINEAKRKLEENFMLNLKSVRGTSDVSMRSQMNETAPSALMASMESLNKRGLISAPTGEAVPVTSTLSTGEQITAKTPNITKSFGGFAGEQYGRVQSAEQARAEAIARSLKQREEELNTEKAQADRLREQTAKAERERIEQEKQVSASKLASQRFSENVQAKQAGLQTTYS